jgi:hypothetical protein
LKATRFVVGLADLVVLAREMILTGLINPLY